MKGEDYEEPCIEDCRRCIDCGAGAASVDDGRITQLNIEGPGEFKISDAETMLGQLG